MYPTRPNTLSLNVEKKENSDNRGTDICNNLKIAILRLLAIWLTLESCGWVRDFPLQKWRGLRDWKHGFHITRGKNVQQQPASNIGVGSMQMAERKFNSVVEQIPI